MSFSFGDQLRTCVYTCFPCFNQPSSPSSAHADHFPDSINHALLAEEDDFDLDNHEHEHSRDYHFPSASRLSRWDLLVSWLFSRRSAPHSFDNHDIQTSALAQSDEADALLLDDISIAFRARSAHRKSSARSSHSHPRTSRQPQPIPSLAATSIHNNQDHQTSRRPKHHLPSHHSSASPRSRSQRSSSPHVMNTHVQHHKLGHTRHESLSLPSRKKSKKHRSKSSQHSFSARTDETGDTDAKSLPSLDHSCRTATTSSLGPLSLPLQLNADVIKFIHQTYNQESRRLYGRDLSRAQIQQVCEYLISRGSGGQIASCPGESGTVTAEPMSGLAEGVEASKISRPAIEIDSLKHIQLSPTEFLQATKQTNTPIHDQLGLDACNPHSATIPSPADDSLADDVQRAPR
ncbi:hypothetical protein PCANC_19115 [Puccinia coronata f. sp. avenae]|uniref:Uncharacterized protein n=1 Tax=Puccinia coronata f. sp. avenae TaxID=200324 RepID=A0A2N5SCA4_9BASI|nr:hypothetical protein PCANC_19115 [Puccinia coronata f. sp. avenae]